MSHGRFSAALILPAMSCRHRSNHSLRRTPARRASYRYDSTWCPGNQEFFDPIIIDGKTLRTLRYAAQYITKLPKAEHDADEWQAAMEALLLVAEQGGPPMRATAMLLRGIDNGDHSRGALGHSGHQSRNRPSSGCRAGPAEICHRGIIRAPPVSPFPLPAGCSALMLAIRCAVAASMRFIGILTPYLCNIRDVVCPSGSVMKLIWASL
jgi:hypothetical protein